MNLGKSELNFLLIKQICISKNKPKNQGCPDPYSLTFKFINKIKYKILIHIKMKALNSVNNNNKGNICTSSCPSNFG